MPPVCLEEELRSAQGRDLPRFERGSGCRDVRKHEDLFPLCVAKRAFNRADAKLERPERPRESVLEAGSAAQDDVGGRPLLVRLLEGGVDARLVSQVPANSDQFVQESPAEPHIVVLHPVAIILMQGFEVGVRPPKELVPLPVLGNILKVARRLRRCCRSSTEPGRARSRRD